MIIDTSTTIILQLSVDELMTIRAALSDDLSIHIMSKSFDEDKAKLYSQLVDRTCDLTDYEVGE